MNLNPIPPLKRFLSNSNRMLSISYKPSPDEFKRTLKVVLLGTIVLGVVGYLISIIISLII